VGDVKEVLSELIAQIRESGLKPMPLRWAGWWETIEGWRKKDCLRYDRNNRDVIKPQHVVETLWNMTKDVEAYVTSDVGQHQMWAAQFYKFPQPRRWINSGGLGTMGVGIPYAMGIKLAKPNRGVLRDRRGLGADVHPGTLHLPAIQHADQDPGAEQPLPGHGAPVAGTRLRGPLQPQLHGRASQLREAAEAYGHVGMLIERPADVEPALREARKLKDRTVFMDFRTDPTENVWPMVKAGQGITQMLLGSEDL
jgi:acetolactate synthase-1/2/3 large subunit